MACYHPLTGYFAKERNQSGKRSITFNRQSSWTGEPVTLACGQCVGCRLEHSRQWAIRCIHEASLHEDNCFITLTYNDENLPEDNSLNLRHYQLFMKKLRKKYAPNSIRFFHCGEYGSLNSRPHYHAILFNHDFNDKIHFKGSGPNTLYTSRDLDQLWARGYSTIGTVTFESAAYVARYIMQKITGNLAGDYYEYTNPKTGEITERKPEYTTMSRRPGIGSSWLLKYKTDVYPDDFVVINNRKLRPPKYYDKSIEITDTEIFDKIKKARKKNLKRHRGNNTKARLRVREKIHLRKLDKLPRILE